MTKEEITKRQGDLNTRLETIAERRAMLIQEVTKMDAEYQATLGALQDCEWWLKNITPETKKETKKEIKKETKLVKTA